MKKAFQSWKEFILKFRTRREPFGSLSYHAKGLLNDEQLTTRQKLYLTIFSNPGLTTKVSGGSREYEADVAGKKATYPWDKMDMSPFKRFADIRSFSIDLSGLDWLFAAFGMKISITPKLKFSRHKNKRLNRYLGYTQLILRDKAKLRDSVAYGKFAHMLMRRSKVYFLNQLRHMNLNGHRTYPYGKVIAVYKKYVRIARTGDTDVKYKRVCIPKSETKYRPLGVPEMEGRIYLGLVNKLIFIGVRDKISPDQHGFQSKKGTLTAGKSIILNVAHKRNIGEFDLEKFFDTVDLTMLMRHVYRKYGISMELAKQLYLSNLNLPAGMIFLGANSFMGELSEEAKRKLRKLASFGDDPDFLSFVANSEERYYTHGVGLKNCKVLKPLKFNGVGQGLPTSPLLSILILEELLFKRIKGTLMYADDGMIYSDDDNAIEDLVQSLEKEPYIGCGVRLSLNKCSGIKRKNVGVKPLKFLGLELDGENGVLKANTRKGSFLVYSMESLIDLVKLRNELVKEESPEDRDKWREPEDSLAALVSSTVYGLIQSRLYAGSYTLENLVQDFDMKFRRGSGVSKGDGRKRLSVFVSTSFATKSLANTIKGLKVTSSFNVKDRESGEEFYSRIMLFGYRLAMNPKRNISKRVKTFGVKDPQWTSLMLVFTPIYKSNHMVLDGDDHMAGGMGGPGLQYYEEPNAVLMGLLAKESSEYEKYVEKVIRESRQRMNYQKYILSE